MPYPSLWLISLVASIIIKCSPTLSCLFHGWFSSLAITFIQREIRWNPAQHSVWTDDDYNMTWGKNSCWSCESVTNEWHRSRIVLTSVVPMMHCCWANSVSTFWPEIPKAYVNCTCDHAGTKTQKVCVLDSPLSPQTLPRHSMNRIPHHATCLSLCVCVGANVRGLGWGLLFRAGVWVCQLLCTDGLRPAAHPPPTHKSTYKHMPYKHDQKWTSKIKFWHCVSCKWSSTSHFTGSFQLIILLTSF